MKKVLLIITSLVLCVMINAQPQPSWVKDPSSILSKGYIYGEGIGKNRKTAIDAAIDDALNKMKSRYIGIEFTRLTSDNLSASKIQIQINNQTFSLEDIYRTPDILVSGDNVMVYLVFDVERKGYNFSFYDTDFDKERIKWNNEQDGTYPFSARVFVPGMAQIYKGSTGKGIAFIAAEVVAVGGIVAFEGLRTSYISKSNTSRNPQDILIYSNNANNMQNIRNGFIVGAAAVYALSFVDGWFAKGKKYATLLSNCKVMPYASPDSNGVILSFNF